MVKRLLIDNRELLLVLLVVLSSAVVAPIIAMVVTIITALLIVRAEKWSLLIVFFYAILTFSDSRMEYFFFSIRVKPLLVLFLGVVAVVLYGKQNKTPKIFLSFIPFLLCGAYGLIFSPMFSISVQKLLSYGMLILLVPLFTSLAYEKDKLKYLEYFIFFGTLMLGVGLILSPFFYDLTYLAGRYRGLLGNPNGLGLFITNIFLLFQVINQKSRTLFSKNYKRLFITVVVLSLIMSGSRQSMMVVLIYYSLSFVFRYSNLLGLVAFFTLAIGFEFIVGQIPYITKLFGLDKTLRVEDVEQIKKGSGRAVAWAFAWNQVNDDFFAAKGLHYTTYVFKYWRSEFRALNHMGNAHNSYLTIWLDTGVQGVVSLFGGVIYHFSRLSKSNYTALPILCSLSFSFMYESWFAASLNPFTIVVLLIISTMYIVDTKSSSNISTAHE